MVSAWVSRIPAIQAEHGLSPAGLGAVLLAIPAGSIVAMLLSGRIIHRYGGRAVVIASTLGFCASLPPIALASNTLALAAALAYFGMGAGIMDVAMNAEGVELERELGRPIMSSFHGMFSLGGMTGAALGGWAASIALTPVTHFTASLVVFAALGAAVFGWLPRTTEPEHQESPFAFRFTRHLAAIGLLAFCVMLGEGAMADWTAIYLRDSLGTGPGLAAAGYAVFSACMMLGRFTGDALTERMGRVRLARTGTLLAGAGLAAALAVASVAPALLGFACVGAGLSTLVPLAYAAGGRAPGVRPSIGVAAVTVLGYTGFLIGPPLIGLTAEYSSLRVALGIVAALSFVAALFAGSTALPESSAAASDESRVVQSGTSILR